MNLFIFKECKFFTASNVAIITHFRELQPFLWVTYFKMRKLHNGVKTFWIRIWIISGNSSISREIMKQVQNLKHSESPSYIWKPILISSKILRYEFLMSLVCTSSIWTVEFRILKDIIREISIFGIGEIMSWRVQYVLISQAFNIFKLINILWKIMPDLNATSKLFWLHCDMVRLATFLVTYINF